jgi:hypothetical protein
MYDLRSPNSAYCAWLQVGTIHSAFPGMSLYECDLAWCLKTYGTATVVNGVLAESTPTESTFHTTTVNWSNMQDPDCVSNLEGIHYKIFGGLQLHSSQWKVFDECPDVMGIAREKDLYIVNFEDEVTVK